MDNVIMHEATNQLSRLLRRIKKVGSFVTAQAGHAMALVYTYHGRPLPRQPGSMRGKVWVAEDFDAPDPEIEKLFQGEEL
jgi:antitoxin (DNA-binding transcriptional repressor) of toxin-antitoxin stability system